MLNPIKPWEKAWEKAWEKYGVGRKAFVVVGVALVLYVLSRIF